MDDIPRRKPNVKREPNSDDDMDDIPRRRPSSQSSANIKREPDADGDLSPGSNIISLTDLFSNTVDIKHAYI